MSAHVIAVNPTADGRHDVLWSNGYHRVLTEAQALSLATDAAAAAAFLADQSTFTAPKRGYR